MKYTRITRKVLSSVLLITFLFSCLIPTAAFADNNSIQLEEGQYVVPITLLDANQSEDGLSDTAEKSQISERGILTVTTTGTFLTYKLYAASSYAIDENTYIKGNGQMLLSSTVNNGAITNEDTIYLTVPVSDLYSNIPLESSVYTKYTKKNPTPNTPVVRKEYLKIGDVITTVDALQAKIFSGDSLEYDITYGVHKNYVTSNYITEEYDRLNCNLSDYGIYQT